MADIRITPASSIMAFTSSLNFKETLTQEASGSLTLYGSGSTGRTDIFSVDGNNGRLFSVSDDLSNSLFSVNTIAGLPVIEAFADNTVVMGQYGQNVLVVTGSNVGVGTSTPSKKLHVVSSANEGIYMQGTSDGGHWFDFKSNNSNLWSMGAQPGLMGWYNRNDGSYKMVISDAGNVGIGTTSPGSYKLKVAGATSTEGLYIPGMYTFGQSSSGIEMQLASTSYNAIRFYQGTDWTGVIHSFGRSWSGGTSVGMINIEGYNGVTIGSWSAPTATFLSSGLVGIGALSPTEILDVRGVIRVSNSGVNDSGIIAFGNYANGAGYYDNGLFRSAVNNIGTPGNYLNIGSYDGLVFTTSNAALGSQSIRMYIDGSTGRVGIGTTSPSYLLDVNGAGRFVFRNNSSEIMDLLLSTEGAASKSKLSLLWYGNETAALKFVRGSNSTGGSMEFWTQPTNGSITQIMTVAENGNVGIGTTSPSGKLSIVDSYYNTFFKDSTSEYGSGLILSGDAGSDQRSWKQFVKYGGTSNSIALTFEVSTGGVSYGSSPTGLTYSEKMRITSGGNVGIGVTSPSNKLHVLNDAFIGNSSAARGIIISGDTNSRIDFNYNFTSTGQITCGNTSNLFIDALGSRAIEFAIDGTVKMEVSPNGNVGIGTAGSVEPSAALEVKSNTQGFLLPRMDDGEMNSIAGPAIGLMVYNTSDDYVYVFGGASWAKLAYV